MTRAGGDPEGPCRQNGPLGDVGVADAPAERPKGSRGSQLAGTPSPPSRARRDRFRISEQSGNSLDARVGHGSPSHGNAPPSTLCLRMAPVAWGTHGCHETPRVQELSDPCGFGRFPDPPDPIAGSKDRFLG